MYKVWASKQAIHGSYIEGIYRQGVTAGWSPAKIMTTLKDRGLSYRKENMLYDYRKARAIEFTKTAGTRANAERFFDKLFEPLRAEKGWNSAQTSDFIRKGDLGILDTTAEMEAYLAWEDEKIESFFELCMAERDRIKFSESEEERHRRNIEAKKHKEYTLTHKAGQTFIQEW